MRRGKTYLRLGRVSNLPTVWTNVLAAVVLAGGTPVLRVLIPLLVACSCFYVGGMFLNDAFDRHHDAREQPHRPIPAGNIAAFEVFAIGFALLAIGIGTVGLSATLAGRGALKPLASGASLGAVVVAYDLWHKKNPLSPALMAACRVLVYVTTALVVAGQVTTPVMIGATCLFAYSIGLTRAAKHGVDGALSWPLILLFVPFLPTLRLVLDVVGVVVWLGFLVWTVKQLGSILDRGPAIGGLIAGISLLDATLIAHAGHPFIAMITAVGFTTTLVLQRWVGST
jgi:4-hydroxybenzoate polyprenyltransferase